MNHSKKLFGTTTVGTKGQVVIPSDAREALSIKSGDRLYVIGSEKAGWVGLIKEDKLRDMVELIAGSIDDYRSLLNDK